MPNIYNSLKTSSRVPKLKRFPDPSAPQEIQRSYGASKWEKPAGPHYKIKDVLLSNLEFVILTWCSFRAGFSHFEAHGMNPAESTNVTRLMRVAVGSGVWTKNQASAIAGVQKPQVQNMQAACFQYRDIKLLQSNEGASEHRAQASKKSLM